MQSKLNSRIVSPARPACNKSLKISLGARIRSRKKVQLAEGTADRGPAIIFQGGIDTRVDPSRRKSTYFRPLPLGPCPRGLYD